LPRANDKGLAVRVQVAANVPAVILGDVTRLRQILVNLMGNAIKFTERGEISVEVSSVEVSPDTRPLDTPTLRFAVRDTGIGIPRDKQHRLFRSFSQLDASTTREFGGTGLGLAISQRLAELMGGALWVESEGIAGRGSTFFFTIAAPVAEMPEAAAPMPQAEAPSNMPLATRLPLRILLVEDALVNRKFALLALEKMGYRATVAVHGQEGVEAVQAENYDVVLMDVQMPVMDGLTATRHIRALPLPQPYIIAMTANAMQGDREICLAAGMDDYVSKPVYVKELSAALERAGQFLAEARAREV
jgi:CheY-like chemotaxis protein